MYLWNILSHNFSPIRIIKIIYQYTVENKATRQTRDIQSKTTRRNRVSINKKGKKIDENRNVSEEDISGLITIPAFSLLTIKSDLEIEQVE